jgi:hypothetical protein
MIEINFHIWLISTIAVTAYSWILIAKWAKKKETEQQPLED